LANGYDWVGEFTGNGLTDFVVGDPNVSPTLLVLRNVGNNTLVDQADLNTVPHAPPLVGDLDKDGTPDVVVVNAAGTILWRRGRPQTPGTFDPPVVVNPNRPALDAALVPATAGPLLAAVDHTGNTVSLYRYRAGGFDLLGTLPTGVLPVEIQTGDLDGNGHTDLVVRNAVDGTLTVYRGAGGGTFRHLTDLPVGRDASDVLLADADHDGRLDLLVTDRSSGDVQLWRNQGDGTFTFAGRFRAGQGVYQIDTSSGGPAVSGAQQTSALAVADVNGDGIPDLVTGNANAHTVGVLIGLGGGRYANPQAFLVGDSTDVVRTADLTGNGRTDLITLGAKGVSVSLNLGGGRFAPPVLYNVGANATGLPVADVNHDGRPDILVGNSFGDVLTLFNKGDGTFQDYHHADSTVTLAVADLNGDGKDDLILTDAALDRVTVQYAQSKQTFAQDRQNGLVAPTAFQVADVNGDGIPDLIVANSGGNDILIYPGLGKGQFGPAQSFVVGTDPVGITLQDLNGDGLPELIVADHGSNDIAILLSSGKGASWTLTRGPRLKVGQGPVSTTVATINGQQTLVVTNSGSNNVELLPSRSNGFFSDQPQDVTFLPVGTTPVQSFVGDFNGTQGLLTVNSGSNDLTLHADFGAKAQTISGAFDGPVAAVEFQHDDVSDQVIANNGDGLLTLLLSGPNGFTMDTLHADLAHPTDLALASVGDTAVAVYVAGEGQETVSRAVFDFIVPPPPSPPTSPPPPIVTPPTPTPNLPTPTPECPISGPEGPNPSPEEPTPTPPPSNPGPDRPSPGPIGPNPVGSERPTVVTVSPLSDSVVSTIATLVTGTANPAGPASVEELFGAREFLALLAPLIPPVIGGGMDVAPPSDAPDAGLRAAAWRDGPESAVTRLLVPTDQMLERLRQQGRERLEAGPVPVPQRLAGLAQTWRREAPAVAAAASAAWRDLAHRGGEWFQGVAAGLPGLEPVARTVWSSVLDPGWQALVNVLAEAVHRATRFGVRLPAARQPLPRSSRADTAPGAAGEGALPWAAVLFVASACCVRGYQTTEAQRHREDI
jgi:hypothetical protein